LIRHVSDPMVLAQLHHTASRSAHLAGDLPRVISELEQALAMSVSRTELDFYFDILQALAIYASMAARHERSTACYDEIFQLATPLGESWHRANALMASAWMPGARVTPFEPCSFSAPLLRSNSCWTTS
jgi:hypothetical protein